MPILHFSIQERTPDAYSVFSVGRFESMSLKNYFKGEEKEESIDSGTNFDGADWLTDAFGRKERKRERKFWGGGERNQSDAREVKILVHMLQGIFLLMIQFQNVFPLKKRVEMAMALLGTWDSLHSFYTPSKLKFESYCLWIYVTFQKKIVVKTERSTQKRFPRTANVLTLFAKNLPYRLFPNLADRRYELSQVFPFSKCRWEAKMVNDPPPSTTYLLGEIIDNYCRHFQNIKQVFFPSFCCVCVTTLTDWLRLKNSFSPSYVTNYSHQNWAMRKCGRRKFNEKRKQLIWVSFALKQSNSDLSFPGDDLERII